MPDTPASIITLNFDPKGLAETKSGAKELESIFGRIGGVAEGLGRSIAGLAGVAGIGAIVHDFIRIETAATRTALAVNNIRGGNGMMNAMLGAQSATGVDAVDLAGGIRASQMFAGGSRLSNVRVAGNYGTFLGHASQATGLDATSLGSLLGQGLSLSGQSFSQQGAQGLLSQAYTASARAGQAGMTGDFLQALTGLVGATGEFGRGRNRAGMAAAMGAAMKGDPRFASPTAAAGAIGSVESVIQGSLGDPRMMAALQMSGSNVGDVLNGNFSAAQRLAKFAKSQGPLASKLFFYSRFGQQGGTLMEDLAEGKVNPQQFAKRMKEADPQSAMRDLMSRAAAQEHTTAADLKKIEGTLMKDVAGPLKAILGILHGLAGHAGLMTGLLGAGVGLKGLGMLGKLGKGRIAGLAGRGVLGAAGVDAAEALGLSAGAWGVGALLGAPAAAAGGLDIGSHIADKLAGKHNLKHTGPLGILRRFKSDEELDLDHLDSLKGGIASGYRKAHNKEAYLKAMIHSYKGDGSEVGFQIVMLLSKLLEETRKSKGGKGATNEGASYMPGSAGSGGASGVQMAAWVALAGGAGGGSGGSGTSFAAAFGGGGAQLVPGSFGSGGGGGGGAPSGGGWKECVLTWYDPALGGINSGDGSKDPHHKTASGEPYDPSAHTCAAPPSYAFGTMIEFAFGGKKITCRVNDRGGAIQGNHFDLSRSAGTYLGIGNSRGKFRVAGSGGGGGKDGGGKKHLPSGAIDPGAKAQPASHGSDYGGMALGGGFPAGSGGGTTTINVNLDNRRIEQARRRTRSM
jgi:hypothetical protein